MTLREGRGVPEGDRSLAGEGDRSLAGEGDRSLAAEGDRSLAGEQHRAPNGARPSPAAPAGAAFFDLDRTMMAGSSGIHFARAAYSCGLIGRRRLVRDGLENLRFRLRGASDARADEVRLRVARAIAGIAVRDLQRLAPRALAGVLPQLYPQMLARAYAHQDAGERVYIVTAASQETADLLAHVLTFDGGVGSRSEIVDGVYTGRDVAFNYREGKVRELQALALRERIDLAASWAYSDSGSDLPMLRTVGHPVAVNPDSELARVAAAEGWEVLRLDRLGSRLKALGGLSALACAIACAIAWASRAHAAHLRERARRRVG